MRNFLQVSKTAPTSLKIWAYQSYIRRILGRLLLVILIFYLSFNGFKLFAESDKSTSGSIDQQSIQDLIADTETDFPLAAREPVIDRLNFLLAQPNQLVGVRQELKRMKRYQELIHSHLEKYELPFELAAIPLVETGYQNLPPQRHGTGLWMFTRDTAQAWDLTVDGKTDERLDPIKATDAAARLLRDYHERFDDWLLALAAYNQGPTRVARIIRETGTNDAWKLIEQGHLNDYAAKVVAAAIIIHHQAELITEEST